AFEPRREPDKCHNDIGLLRRCDCLILQQLVLRAPFERDAAVRDASGLYVLDANRMWVRVCQRKRELLQPAEVAPAGRQFYARLGLSWRSVKLLVIEIDGELSLASAGITQGDAKLKIICVCDGSRN